LCGTILINMASFPSSCNAIQWAEHPPQVCWSLGWTVDDDDDATSTFSGPSSLVTSSQCTMFRASTSHTTWQRCTLRSVDGLAVNILELQRTHRFKKWIVTRHFSAPKMGLAQTWQLVVSSLNIAELLRTRRVWSHSKPGSVRIQRIKSTIGYRKEIEGYIILFNTLLLEHRANDTQQPFKWQTNGE